MAGAVWNAAPALLSFLARDFSSGSDARWLVRRAKRKSKNTVPGLRRVRVLELGAGTGVVAIGVAGMAASSPTPIDVVATDIPSALDLIRLNVENNRLLLHEAPDSISVTHLSWGSEAARQTTGTHGPFDLVLISDCTYRADLFDMLKATLKRVLRGKVPALLAHSVRVPDESDLNRVLLHFNRDGLRATRLRRYWLPETAGEKCVDIVSIVLGG